MYNVNNLGGIYRYLLRSSPLNHPTRRHTTVEGLLSTRTFVGTQEAGIYVSVEDTPSPKMSFSLCPSHL